MKCFGEEWLLPDEAIRAVEQARALAVPLYGFDGGYLTEISTQPSLADSKDYSVPKYPNTPDPYGDAIRFIADRKDTGLRFVLVLGRQGEVRIRRAPTILAVANALLWGTLVYGGHEGVRGVEARIGHTSLGQAEFYVAFPLLMLTVSLVPTIILSQTKWPVAGTLWAIASLLVMLPYGCLYTGGM